VVQTITLRAVRPTDAESDRWTRHTFLSAVFVAACLTLAAQAGCGKATARTDGTADAARDEGTAAARQAVADEVFSPIPSGCGEDVKAAVKGRVAAEKALALAQKQQLEQQHEAFAKIEALREMITEELNKPAGAVRVQRMQELEAEMLVRRRRWASETDELKIDVAKADERLAEINAVLARCNNFAASTARPTE
jgi:hypothetical protein